MINRIIRKLNYTVKGKLWRLIVLLKGDHLKTFRLEDGIEFDYPFDSVVGAHLFISGKFEDKEMSWVRQTLKPGNIVFDIGANGGIYTVAAAKAVGSSGHVYAFEPGRRELELLRNNIIKNNLSNVTVVERAVSDKTSSADFVVSQDGAMNSLAENSHAHQKVIYHIEVKTISLNEFVDEYNVSKVDFVKIDVEGAEHLVFRGMQHVLASNDQIKILFECSNSTSSGFGYSSSDLLSELMGLGLSIGYISDESKLVDINQAIENNEIDSKIYNFVATKKKLFTPL
jgi:FkbM family methyltransferase